MFDFDGGMLTAATMEKHKIDKFYDERKIEFDIFKDQTPAAPTAWLRAKEKILKFSSLCANKRLEYDAIVVDSLTGMAVAAQHQIMAQAGRPLGKPEIQHYGLIVSEMENMLLVLMSMNVLLLLTGHAMPITIDEVVRMQVLCVGQKLPSKMPWMFDEVWYAKSKAAAQGKINYILTGRSSSSIRCRTRANFGQDVIHNDIGLVGVLEKIDYKYGGKEE